MTRQSYGFVNFYSVIVFKYNESKSEYASSF